MTATLTLITATRDDVLKVPRRALRFRPRGEEALPSMGNLRRLWVENEDGKAEALQIRVGVRDDEFVEVSGGGVEAGRPIILGYQRES
jgi:multidrug efflux pump subunit AcrA (membrane-fusion protein)